jgi:hypothetical protein
VHRERQFPRLGRHTRIMVRQHQRRGAVDENQHWQTEIVVHWEGLLWKSQNYCSTGDSRAEYTYSSWRPCCHKSCPAWASQIHGRASIAEPLITEINSFMRIRLCNDHKTWTSDNWKCARDMVRWVLLQAVPSSRRVYVWRTHKEAYNPECLVPTVKHGGGSVMVWAAISWYCILWLPLLPFMA